MKSSTVLFLATVLGVVCLYFVSQIFTSEHSNHDDSVSYTLRNEMSPHTDDSLPVVDLNNMKFKNETNNFLRELRKKYGPIEYTGIKPVDTTLNAEEEKAYKQCMATIKKDYQKSQATFWGKNEHIRTKNHTYLKREDAVLLEVGGNQGDDATRFVNLFNPRYIILEPLEEYTNILRKKFADNPRVTVVNLGLGKTTEIVMVKMDGNNACATSKFGGKGGETPLYIVNATSFLLKLGLGMFDIDLMTLNCEGCEYEALESVLSSTLVNHFRNIQFATHSTLGVPEPHTRYCKIRTLLSRTHRPIYEYKVIWESWRRKDLPAN